MAAAASLAAASMALAGALTSASARPVSVQALCLGKRATIVGTARADRLIGTADADVIIGLGGDDSVSGRHGNDLVCGGPGADLLDGGAGRDRGDGGAGRDVCLGIERKTRCEPAPPTAPGTRDFRVGPLIAGTYVNAAFQPAVSFTIGPGWEGRVTGRFASEAFAVVRNPGPSTPCASETGLFLVFNHFSLHDSVADTVAYLSAVPGTNATKPLDAVIGGIPAKQIDVTASGARCVRVSEIGAHLTIDLDPGDRVRYYALDVNGLTVLVAFGGPGSRFDSFAGLAERVVATIRWLGYE